MPQSAVMLKHQRPAIDCCEGNTAIPQQVHRVELVFYQVSINWCWEGDRLLAVKDSQQFIPSRDQDSAVVIREQKQLSGVTISLSAWNGLYLIADDFLQTDPILRGINVAADHRQSLEIRFVCRPPDMHLFAVPAEYPVI